MLFPDRRPGGGLTQVDPVSGGLRVQGLASDPDGGNVSVQIRVDGVLRETVVATGGSFSLCLTS